MLVVTLGDLLLDVIVRLREPLATGADAEAETLTAPGGQAANVAAWVGALGQRARCVARRGGDAAGVVLAAGPDPRGGGPVRPGAGAKRGVGSIVAPRGRGTMASHPGPPPPPAPGHLHPRGVRRR